MIVYTDKHRIPFEIDAEDYEVVSWYKWFIATRSSRPNRKNYVTTNAGKYNTSYRRPLELHVFLLGPAPEGLEWDHKDRNPLNNHRSNLRAVIHAENARNVSKHQDNTSGVKGVFRHQGKWVVYLSTRYIGIFSTLEEAAVARIEAEHKLWGRVYS